MGETGGKFWVKLQIYSDKIGLLGCRKSIMKLYIVFA